MRVIMTHRRFSIGNLMVVVGIVALNLGIGRLIFSYQPEFLFAGAPAGLTLEFGVFSLIRSRGRRRAFWAGFVAALMLAIASLIWGLIFSGSVGIQVDPTTGERITVRTPGILAGDQIVVIWSYYGVLVERCLERLSLAGALVHRDWPDPVLQVLAGLAILLPTVVLALAGGGLALVLACLAEARQEDAGMSEDRLSRSACAGPGVPPGSRKAHQGSRA
jgi:hypothetical protein